MNDIIRHLAHSSEVKSGEIDRLTVELATAKEKLRTAREALGVIAAKTCGSACNDPLRIPALAGDKRCARCIAVDAIDAPSDPQASQEKA